MNPLPVDAASETGITHNLYEDAAAGGYLIKDSEGKPYLHVVATFPSGMIDLTNPKAVDWTKGILEDNMLGTGASGWMADFGESLPVDAKLYNGDPFSFHNQYPAAWGQDQSRRVPRSRRLGRHFDVLAIWFHN